MRHIWQGQSQQQKLPEVDVKLCFFFIKRNSFNFSLQMVWEGKGEEGYLRYFGLCLVGFWLLFTPPECLAPKIYCVSEAHLYDSMSNLVFRDNIQ